MTSHPYYISKARLELDRLEAPDADPTELASWAERATGDMIAFITADGGIVGHGRYIQDGPHLATAVADKETCERYGIAASLAGMACAHIERKLAQPVRMVKASAVM